MTAADPTAHPYRREARRLRGRFGDEPARLCAELRRLSDRRDATCAAAIGPPDPTVVFARNVARHLQSGILPFADRLALLRGAIRSGIDRADANLIILAVQERLQEQPDGLACSTGTTHPFSRYSAFVVLSAALVTAIEIAMGLIVWRYLAN
jgi:hypothetical protein